MPMFAAGISGIRLLECERRSELFRTWEVVEVGRGRRFSCVYGWPRSPPEGTCRLRGAASWLDVRVELAPVLSWPLLTVSWPSNNRVQDRFQGSCIRSDLYHVESICFKV